MDETKVGGVINEPKLEEELPADLEQEKKEIEARIDQHVEKLQEIAKVFNIDINDHPKKDEWIEVEYDRLKDEKPPHILFIFNHGIKGEKYLEFGGDFDGELVPRGIREQDFSLFHVNRNLIATNQEKKFTGYFDVMERSSTPIDCRSLNLEGWALKTLGVKKESKKDPILKSFLDHIKTLDKNPKYIHQMLNYIPLDMDDEHRLLLAGKLDDAPRVELKNYREAQKLKRYVTIGLLQEYNDRLKYIIHRAICGDLSFKEISDESRPMAKVYEVDPSFQFTEEDARKAKELDLPWSRIGEEQNAE